MSYNRLTSIAKEEGTLPDGVWSGFAGDRDGGAVSTVAVSQQDSTGLQLVPAGQDFLGDGRQGSAR